MNERQKNTGRGAALPGGKWRFIEVSSNEDSDDVKRLLLLKREPGKKLNRKAMGGIAVYA